MACHYFFLHCVVELCILTFVLLAGPMDPQVALHPVMQVKSIAGSSCRLTRDLASDTAKFFKSSQVLFGRTRHALSIRTRRQSGEVTAGVFLLAYGRPFIIRCVVSDYVLLQPYDTASAFVKRLERHHLRLIVYRVDHAVRQAATH